MFYLSNVRSYVRSYLLDLLNPKSETQTESENEKPKRKSDKIYHICSKGIIGCGAPKRISYYVGRKVVHVNCPYCGLTYLYLPEEGRIIFYVCGDGEEEATEVDILQSIYPTTSESDISTDPEPQAEEAAA